MYKVVPYTVNTSIFKMPNDPPAGYNELVRQAAKAYNYMYTGLNKDIFLYSEMFFRYVSSIFCSQKFFGPYPTEKIGNETEKTKKMPLFHIKSVIGPK